MKRLGAAVLGFGWLVSAGAARAGAPAATTEAARAKAQPAKAADGHAQLAQAEAHMKLLYEGIWKIERVRKAAVDRPVRAGCVDERLADARAHVRIGAGELATVQQSLASEGGLDGKEAAAEVDRRAYALSRLEMLEQRTRDAERAARVCVEDDAGGVDVVQVSVEIAPTVVDRPLPPAPAAAANLPR